MNKNKTYTFAGKLLLLFVLFGPLCSCKTAKPKVAEVAPEEKTAFYTLALTRDSVLNVTKAEIKNVTVVNSKIKYFPEEAKAKDPNFLKIDILYKNNISIQVFTEHPLYKRFDLYSESGEIESKSISLSQGEVFFRVPYYEHYKKITIIETVNFKASAPLILKK